MICQVAILLKEKDTEIPELISIHFSIVTTGGFQLPFSASSLGQ